MTKFLNVLLEEREPEKEAVGFFGNWAKHSIEQKQKPRYDWRYENSITNRKGKKIELDGDYSQWRTNSIIASYKELCLIVNEINIHYDVTDQMHYDYLYGSIRKHNYDRAKPETEKEKKDRKKKEELISLVSTYYKYNTIRAREALRLLSNDQIDYIKQKQEKGGVK